MQTTAKPSLWLLPCLLFACLRADAHGSVEAGDVCEIKIGFYSAHFAIYQPQTRQHEEFCEDIPDATETIFVIEYLHDVMREVPVDFRIIADTENRGRFVNWDDILAIDDIERDTVFYQTPAVREDGVFLVHHDFAASGDYIGIVTIEHPTLDRLYTAVFPFHVGETDWGYVPLFIGLAVVLQLTYWILTGGLRRLGRKKEEAEAQ